MSIDSERRLYEFHHQLRNKLRYLIYSRIYDGAEQKSCEYPLSSGEIIRTMIKNGVLSPMNSFLYPTSLDVLKWFFKVRSLIGRIIMFQKFSFEVMVYGRRG